MSNITLYSTNCDQQQRKRFDFVIVILYLIQYGIKCGARNGLNYTGMKSCRKNAVDKINNDKNDYKNKPKQSQMEFNISLDFFCYSCLQELSKFSVPFEILESCSVRLMHEKLEYLTVSVCVNEFSSSPA